MSLHSVLITQKQTKWFRAVSEVPTLTSETLKLSFPDSRGCRSVAEHLPSECKALGSMSTTNRKHSHAQLIHSVFLQTLLPLHI